MRAIGYARVSTDGQAEKGISLAAQQSRIRAMATLQEAELTEVIVDAGASGKNLERPGMRRIVTLLEKRTVDAVIVARLDRLSRSVADLGRLIALLEKRGVQLLSVSESLDMSSAAGRLFINIAGSLAQHERELIAERTRSALQFEISQNQWVGDTAYGYRVCADRKTVEANPAEQRVRRTITRLRAQGRSLRQIAAHLNKERRFTRSGSPWIHCYVARVLKAV